MKIMHTPDINPDIFVRVPITQYQYHFKRESSRVYDPFSYDFHCKRRSVTRNTKINAHSVVIKWQQGS